MTEYEKACKDAEKRQAVLRAKMTHIPTEKEVARIREEVARDIQKHIDKFVSKGAPIEFSDEGRKKLSECITVFDLAQFIGANFWFGVQKIFLEIAESSARAEGHEAIRSAIPPQIASCTYTREFVNHD